jgi:hypothetical protein
MSTPNYLRLQLKCPDCDVYLFGTNGTASGDKAVFCAECHAGGSYEQIVVNRARLIPRFVHRQYVERLLRPTGPLSKDNLSGQLRSETQTLGVSRDANQAAAGAPSPAVQRS